ncbi:aromatic ring-opening dioxygenase LigA [Streptomyces himastatinicus]|nr:aromatic ring-opening dioxygenase LigA [Streptomyces himastatinicus]
MTASVPPLPKIELLIDALEQLVTLPPGRRGPAPQILLTQLTEGPEAGRIADGLCARFSAGGRARVPFAQVAGEAEAPRQEHVGATFQKIEEELLRNRPGGFGRLRLPQFRLMCGIVEADLAGCPSGTQATELRNRSYEAHCARSVFLSALQAVSGGEEPPPSIPGTAWYWLRRPLFGLLPRWWYGRRHGRRMTRKGSWYRTWAELPEGGPGFFADACRLTVGAPGAARREPIVDVLLRALLADLERAFRHPRLSPWGRRRRHRVVLVFPQPPAIGDDTGRLLEQFPQAVEHTGCTGVMLTAAVRPGRERTESFAEAAITLKSWIGTTGAGGARVVRVGVEPHADDEDAARWLGRYPEIAVGRSRSDAAPRVEAAVAAVAGVTVLGLLGGYGVAVVTARSDTACLGGSGGDSAGRSRLPKKSPQEVYQQAVDAIDEQNEKAVKAARSGAVVRTVGYLGVPVTADDWSETKYSGAIPEVRGIALAQEEINEEAADQKSSKVWLKVRVMDAGERFSEAPAVAEKLKKEIKAAERAGEGEQFLGVVGLGQSRPDTLRARDILAGAGLPLIGTAATAEEMQNSPMYRQVAPDNHREAGIAAAFARHANIVQTGPRTCAPARKAVVIGDPTDIYSANLSDRFAEKFGDVHHIWYPVRRPSASPSAEQKARGDEWVSHTSQMVTSICRRLKEEPRTVVYWAARAHEFQNFLTDFDRLTGCNGQSTVLGGNDLDNAVVEQQRPSEKHLRLRLYYAAQALAKDSSPNVKGDDFRRRYAAAYKSDLWSNDARVPLASDALGVLSEGISAAYQSAGTAPFGRGGVQSALDRGVGGAEGLRGATGSLIYGEGAKVPVNKRLLILHDTRGGSPEIALECGIRDSGDEAKTWGPRGAFDCPRDQDDDEDGKGDD